MPIIFKFSTLITDFLEKSPSWGSNSHSVGQEVPWFYGTRRFIVMFTGTPHGLYPGSVGSSPHPHTNLPSDPYIRVYEHKTCQSVVILRVFCRELLVITHTTTWRQWEVPIFQSILQFQPLPKTNFSYSYAYWRISKFLCIRMNQYPGVSVNSVAIDGNCLFRSSRPFVAFWFVQNNARLRINAV
jgi:hypothetical protein